MTGPVSTILGNALREDVATELHEFAAMRVGRKAEHHAQALVARQAAAEEALAATVGRIVVLDVVEQEGGAVTGALGEAHDRAEFDVPVHFRVDFLDLASLLQRVDPTSQIAIGDGFAFNAHAGSPRLRWPAAMGAACVSCLARPAGPAGFPAGHTADVIGAVAPTSWF